jgi:hypothetical protein
MTGYQGARERVVCPACGQTVTKRIMNRRGDARLPVPLVAAHRVPGKGRATTRAECSGSGMPAESP